jgi:rubrerythrin
MEPPSPHGVTSLEALGIAIRSEMDSRDVYRELAARAGDPLLRRRFELLAAEEERHREYLEERYRDLSGDVPLRLPPSTLPRGLATAEERARSTLRAVLTMAIEEERRSREFYLRAAGETDDLSGQAMFRYLADLEYQHWMALGQEMDMMLRYPNYGRPGPSPWRSERSLGTGSEP